MKNILPDGSLKCGEWNCRRAATQLNLSQVKRFNEGSRDEMHARRALVCNIHAGAIKRQKWSSSDVILITDPLAVELVAFVRKYYERLDKAHAKEAAAKRRESEERYAKNLAEAWATYDDPYAVELVEETRWDKTIDRKLSVHEVGGSDHWSAWNLSFDDRDEDMPVYIGSHRGGTMTPTTARTLAQALLKAADMADAMTEERRAKRK